MDPQRQQRLAVRLDALAMRHPRAYHAGVVALGAAGYLYLVAIPVALLATVAALLTLATAGRGVLIAKLALPLLALCWMVLRALWVRVEPPAGIALRREEAPALFRDVEALADAVRAPRPHVVLLVGEMNAAVVQVPRLGIFGWPRNYLLLGVPLLHALSPTQARAVLAHEIAHLSRAHGRMGVWIYRVRRTWGQLLAALEESGHHGAWIFTGFIRWYGPRFDAATHALSRAQEFEADRLAASAAGAEALGDALLRLEVCGRFESDHFWTELWRGADGLAAPPEPGPTALVRALHAAMPPTAEREWVRAAMEADTDPLDTHPALRARLAALGHPAAGEVQPPLPDPEAERAADRWLGAAGEAALRHEDRTWWEQARTAWEEQHREARLAEARLAVVEEEAERQPADAELLWELARLRLQRRGDDHAVEPLRRLLAAAPAHPGAHLELGRILAAADDDAGPAHLERAMEVEPALTPAVSFHLQTFWSRRGDEERAADVRLRAVEHTARCLDVGRALEAPLHRGDTLLPPAPDDGVRTRLATALTEVPAARRVYLSRRPVPRREGLFVHVLVVEAHGPYAGVVDALLARTEFLGDRVVFPLYATPWLLRRRLRRLAGSEVLPAAASQVDLLPPRVALPA